MYLREAFRISILFPDILPLTSNAQTISTPGRSLSASSKELSLFGEDLIFTIKGIYWESSDNFRIGWEDLRFRVIWDKYSLESSLETTLG